MNSINKTILAIIGAAIITGCSFESAPIDSLVIELDSIKETNFQPSPLSIGEKYALDDLGEATNEEKIFDVFLDWQFIKAAQSQIDSQRLELESNVQTMKELVSLFKERSLTLSLEEITWVRGNRIQLREYREDIKATTGLVYAPIKELKGMYSIENIDLIADTFKQAADNMAIRLDVIVNVNAIISEVNNFLTSKVG